VAENLNSNFSKFIIVWSGQMISAIGSGLTAFTLGVYVFNATGTATSYSLIILCAFLPFFVLSPFGGVLADRFDRRLLIILGDLGAATGLVFILAMILFWKIELWQIYVGAAFSSVFVAVQAPAYKAIVSDLVPPESYAKASGMVQLAGAAQFLIAPVIAGLLMGFMEIKYILIIDILTYLVAIICVIVVRKQTGNFVAAQERSRVIDELKEGFVATVSNKGILSLISIIALILFYIGLLQSLLGPMVLSFADVKTLGIAQSVCAIGMLVSSLFIGVLGQSKSQARILAIFLGLMGIFFASIGLSTNIYLIVIPGFLFFMTVPFVNSSIEVLIRKNIDNATQGRVWSFVSVITYLGSVFAYLSAGFLADHVFNPLFQPDGMLANSLGWLVGTGAGRGIGFMFVVSGLSVTVLAFFIFRSRQIRALEV
jgi:MFS family permease